MACSQGRPGGPAAVGGGKNKRDEEAEVPYEAPKSRQAMRSLIESGKRPVARTLSGFGGRKLTSLCMRQQRDIGHCFISILQAKRFGLNDWLSILAKAEMIGYDLSPRKLHHVNAPFPFPTPNLGPRWRPPL